MSATTTETERLTLARLPSGTEVTTRLHTISGPTEGPTAYVHAAVHGREVNGVEVIRRVYHELADREFAGEVRLVPVANPLTFDLQRYTLPTALDHTHLWTANMERTWPGDRDGSLHERMAARLWEHVHDADAVVDLHTGSPATHPHSVYTDDDPASRELARVFGTDLVMPSAVAPRTPDWPTDRDVSGTLRAIASHEGIPSMIAELGEAYRVEENTVAMGVTGVLNVLKQVGVLDGEPVENGEALLVTSPMHSNRSDSFDAAASGLFVTDPDVWPGKRVSAGQSLGTVYHPTTFEPVHEVETSRDGILYHLRRRGTVTGGERLAAVAVEKE
jgi:predicted deacylase